MTTDSASAFYATLRDYSDMCELVLKRCNRPPRPLHGMSLLLLLLLVMATRFRTRVGIRVWHTSRPNPLV